MRSRTLFVFLLGAALALWRAPAAAEQKLGYVDILNQLTDLDRLTRVQAGCRAGQYSSWDRNGRKVWGANGDAGQYLRVEPNGEAVMMDQDGPGAIYRIWSANPRGKIRIYLDGAETPSYEFDFNGIFLGKEDPFIKPLVWQREPGRPSSDCYVPIPFGKHIKITADKAHIQYYHFDYITFPKSATVESFHLPLSRDERAQLIHAADVWGHPGIDPKPALPKQATITRRFMIKPGRSVTVADLRGPGSIRAVRVIAASAQRYVWRKVLLQMTWDGAPWPQVLSPIGPFFGFDWTTPNYGSVISGCKDGQAYFHYAMPFRKRAKIELRNLLEADADIRVEVDWAPTDQPPADMCYFYARWRSEPDSRTFDYPFLHTAGRGHFVGVAMPIDHPLAGWWGEGDEKIWVDDDDFPPWIGTGSEDYFGDAWGITYLSQPSWGAALDENHRTANYRWHFMDLVPFDQRFRMTIENYGPNGQGPRGQYEYTSTAFWYQAELTPPFADLANWTVTGGDDPNGPPVKVKVEPTIFHDLDRAAVRTYGLGALFATEAEVALRDAVRSGKANIVTDALRPYEFSREEAVDFGKVREGQVLGTFSLKCDQSSVYQPELWTAPEKGLAPLTIRVDAQTPRAAGNPAPNITALESVYLDAGEHQVAIVAAGSGNALLDCVRFTSVPRTADAMEVEELAVTGAGKVEKAIIPGASAGRVLAWTPAAQGDALKIRLPKPVEKPYVLGVRVHRVPGAPTVQAYLGDKPIGPAFDLGGAAEAWDQHTLPLGVLPKGATDLELRATRVGTAPARLDYLRWGPSIIHPESTAGVWARVARSQGCDAVIQDLGPNWLLGHHLWMNPSGRDALVDIEVNVPTEGDYDLTVCYTTSHDYAIIQASLDGKPIGKPVDTFTVDVLPGTPTALGTVHLAVGAHTFRVQAVDKNAKSDGTGYLMGVHYLKVVAR